MEVAPNPVVRQWAWQFGFHFFTLAAPKSNTGWCYFNQGRPRTRCKISSFLLGLSSGSLPSIRFSCAQRVVMSLRFLCWSNLMLSWITWSNVRPSSWQATQCWSPVQSLPHQPLCHQGHISLGCDFCVLSKVEITGKQKVSASCRIPPRPWAHTLLIMKNNVNNNVNNSHYEKPWPGWSCLYLFTVKVSAWATGISQQ